MKKTPTATASFLTSVLFNIRRSIFSRTAILFSLLILQSQAFSFSLNNFNPARITKSLKLNLLHNAFPADTWVFDRTVQNVDLYHMVTACEGKKVVFLKFNNRNTYKVKNFLEGSFCYPDGKGKGRISWHEATYTSAGRNGTV